jgi:hypothetical protein
MDKDKEIVILKSIKNLQLRPGMFLPLDNVRYLDYQTYLIGYLSGIYDFSNINYEREISKWYQGRVSLKAPNMIWFCQFELVNKDLCDKDLVDKLFNELILFFENRIG